MSIVRNNWKMIIGVALLFLSIYAVYQNISRTIATEANVNTELHSIVTPISGVIERPLPQPGEMVGSDYRIAVRNDLLDEGSIHRLRREIGNLEAKIESIERNISVMEVERVKLVKINQDYIRYRSKVLEARQLELHAEIESLEAQWLDALDRNRRMVRLGEQGAVSQRETITSGYALRAAEQEKQARLSRSEGLDVEREALLEGYLVTDNWSERPQAGQRAQQLEYEITLARLELDELRAQRRNLYEQLAHEQHSLGSRREASVAVPEGRVWWRAHRGQYRVAGDAVGDIAICEGAVVTATLTRSDFERLSIGTPATFTLRRSESGSERLHGRVVALVGSTVENSRRMALAYGRSALANGYGAIVRLSDRSQLSCRIGISGRLELMTRSGGWLDPRGWVHALGGMFDSDGQEAARWTGEEANRGVARGSLQLDLPPRSG